MHTTVADLGGGGGPPLVKKQVNLTFLLIEKLTGPPTPGARSGVGVDSELNIYSRIWKKKQN